MPNITINGYSFEPVDEGPELATFGIDTSDTSQTDYVLVQTEGPLKKSQRSELIDLGAELLAYEPENTYVARYPNNDLSDIRHLSFVRIAIPYPTFVKVAQELLDDNGGLDRVAIFSGTALEVNEPGTEQQVDIILHQGVDPASIKERVADIAGIETSDIEEGGEKLRAWINSARLQDLSYIDEVRQVEQVFDAELFNDVAMLILQADSVPNGSLPLRGEGQVVAVCDTGFDLGSETDVHPAFSGRVAKLYPMSSGADANDTHGHGTHVAGSILGDGVATGYGPVVGAAPDAQLVLQATGNKLQRLPRDLKDLFDPPYINDGARIHNNSWGNTNSNGRYNSGSREVDNYVWNQRDMLICFAAGNPGRDANKNGVIDLGSVQAPGTAKNCLTIGASENNRPEQSRVWATGSWKSRYPADPIKNDLWADNPMGMAAFSGRGPTNDKRTKPDVVAPGTSILSAHSRAAKTRHPSQQKSLEFWGVSPDLDYRYMGGTSMASPLVAGCAALVREYLIKQEVIESPSAALVKAVLINGCVELEGQYNPSEAGSTPNLNSGFGRVNVQQSLTNEDNGILIFRDEQEQLDSGDEISIDISIPESLKTLQVTLVWTDQPGHSLVNDLDLIVYGVDGTERHGNMPLSSTEFDRTNNVEQIIWHNALAGDYRVLVRAFRIPLQAQSFALAIRGDI